jgi:polyisoprenoid-binding protein YceI
LNTGGDLFTRYATANTDSDHVDSCDGRQDELLRMFADWHEPVERLIAATDEDQILNRGACDLAPLIRWGKARVMLLGDAAHPCTPILGLGGCMALEDAVVLAISFTRERSPETALRRYELLRRQRTRHVQQRSLLMGHIGQWEIRLMTGGRGVVTRMLPARIFERNLKRAYSYALRVALICVALICGALPLLAQEKPIDTQRSTITVHVGKSGLLSAAAHDHTIDGPISSGTLREPDAPHIEFTVETAKMTVRADPKVDAKTQATIQKDMDEMVLETKNFPRIAFRSSRVEKMGAQWKVDGDLSLHGITRPVSLIVKQAGESYTTHIVLKQSDFGIKPISLGGGTIRVKNEVEIDFQIVPGKI